MKRFDIAVIPGDGIGREVVPAGCRVLDTVAEVHGGFRLHYKSYPWSCAWYLKHGKMMPDDGLKRIGDSDAIFLGAVGFPGVADHVSSLADIVISFDMLDVGRQREEWRVSAVDRAAGHRPESQW